MSLAARARRMITRMRPAGRVAVVEALVDAYEKVHTSQNASVAIGAAASLFGIDDDAAERLLRRVLPRVSPLTDEQLDLAVGNFRRLHQEAV